MNNKKKPREGADRKKSSPSTRFLKEKKGGKGGAFAKNSTSKPYAKKEFSGTGAKRKSASSGKFVKGAPDDRAANSYPKPESKTKTRWQKRGPSSDKPAYGAKKEFGSDKPYRAKKEFGAAKPYAKRDKPDGDSRERRSSSSDKPYRAKKEFGSDKPYKAKKEFGSDKPYRAKKEFGAAKPYAKRDKPEGDSRDRRSSSTDKPYRAKKEFGAAKPYAKRDRPDGDSRDRRSSSTDKPYRAKKEFGAAKPYVKRDKPEGDSRDRRSSSSDKPYRAKKEFGAAKPYVKRDKPEGDSRERRSSSSDKPYRTKKEFGAAKPFTPRGSKPYTKKDEGAGGERRERPSYSDSKSDKPRRFSKRTAFGKEKPDVVVPEEIRLNRYISNAGVCSRRDADELIKEGRVQVNGVVIEEMGYKVKRSDVVKFDDKTLRAEKLVYLLLNKPKDYITTMEDPEDRKTVMNLIKNACDERIYPVGRLDRNTTGLLLFTNDGDLAKKLTHPSHNVKKIYQADLDKPLTEEDFEKIAGGKIELEDGPVKVDKVAIVSANRMSVGLEIHEGRNRIVRRLFEHLGYDVVKLDRVMYAGLDKKDLSRGKWKMLSEKEVIQLKHFS